MDTFTNVQIFLETDLKKSILKKMHAIQNATANDISTGHWHHENKLGDTDLRCDCILQTPMAPSGSTRVEKKKKIFGF